MPQTTANANASRAAPSGDGRDRPEDQERLGADGAAGHRVGDHRIADPAAARGDAVAVHLGEGPRVVGVDADVRVARRRGEDLLQQPGPEAVRADLEDGQADRRAEDQRHDQAGEAGRQDPDRMPGAALPGEEPLAEARVGGQCLRLGPFRVLGPERPPDRHRSDDRHEDRELRLDQRGDHRPDRCPLRVVAPELAKAEQQEHDAERVDLSPGDRVEPRDRVDDDDDRAEHGSTPARPQLEGHRPDQPADHDVGQDRRDLDQVADAAHCLSREADQVQDIEIAGRVVEEEVAVVDAVQSVAREVRRPRVEGVQVELQTGPGEGVCDDEPSGEREAEDGQDRDGALSRPGGPRRCVRAPARPVRCAGGQAELASWTNVLRWIAG